MTCYNQQRQGRLRLGIEEDGSPYIAMRNARGKEIWPPARKGRGKNVAPLRIVRTQKKSKA